MSPELFRLEKALRALKATLPGSTPDNRIEAIVKCIEAIQTCIERFERQLEVD